MKKQETLSFSEDEIFKEIDKYRQNRIKIHRLTKKQIEFIKKCRTGKDKVSYAKITLLWNKVVGWNKVTKNCILDWTNKLEANNWKL